MGEPATPSQAERAETLALCKAIVRAVREDERMPLGLVPLDVGLVGYVRVHKVPDVEQLAFRLAQLATLLAEQLAEARAAKEELADLASRIDVGDGYVDHIAALRKVGA